MEGKGVEVAIMVMVLEGKEEWSMSDNKYIYCSFCAVCIALNGRIVIISNV